MSKVGCVIVTYNKINLLKECLAAINKQTVNVDEIFIVDNASTDQTKEYIQQLMKEQSNINYYQLEQNIGGAGGFNYGLKKAYESDIDYVWIMDDDTIPKKDALEHFLKHAHNEELDWGFLCGNVKWIDEQPCLMNIPKPDKVWSKNISAGLVKVISASFVSLFIRKETLEKVGLPIKEFFIWGDDVEFTRRISKYSPGYMVIESEAIHKMNSNIPTNILKDEKDRINRYFFDYRNKVFIAKQHGLKASIKNIFSVITILIKIVAKNNTYKAKKLKIVLKGFFVGLFFNPDIEYVNKD